ncbi:thioredoxin family protein [Mangrovimonas aestuarii]|uniref:thioredoxin family protein n=1 Tax=Mangrovimonas aestuarii TaxID=3018443 RepID=UPI002377F324|nr:thioredoxin family protein [Mangrovimonas aestuarii]
MKNIIFFTCAVALLLTFYSFTSSKSETDTLYKRGIDFHKGSWDEALELAKKEDKLIFLDIYATWCGPCKLMKRKTFSDKDVGEFYNKNFINVSYNGEKKEGAMLARKYGVRSYPSFLFIDKDGRLLGKSGGYRKPYPFINLGKRYVPINK